MSPRPWELSASNPLIESLLGSKLKPSPPVDVTMVATATKIITAIATATGTAIPADAIMVTASEDEGCLTCGSAARWFWRFLVVLFHVFLVAGILSCFHRRRRMRKERGMNSSPNGARGGEVKKGKVEEVRLEGLPSYPEAVKSV